MKKWQLLLIVLTICIVAFLAIVNMGKILTTGIPKGMRWFAPIGTFWFNQCENISEFSLGGANYTAFVNNTSMAEGNGSLDLMLYNFVDSLTVTLTNSTMNDHLGIQAGMYPNLWYGTYARLSEVNVSLGCPTYLIYWLSGSYNFHFYGSGGNFSCSLTDPHGLSTFTTDIPYDTNWHWFEVQVLNASVITPNTSLFAFWIDGDLVFSTIEPNQPFYPDTFLSVCYGASNRAHWQIDYLRTAATEQYPPPVPRGEVYALPQDLFTEADILLMIGLIGAMFDIVAPVFTVETFMDGDYVGAFGYGFLLMLLGTTFIIAWLW